MCGIESPCSEAEILTQNIPSQEVEMESFRDLESGFVAPYLNDFLGNNDRVLSAREIQGKIVNDWYHKITFPNTIKIRTAGRYYSIEYSDESGARQELCYDIFGDSKNLLLPHGIHEAVAEKNEALKEKINEFDILVSAMHDIFIRNSQERTWDFKPGRGYIGEEDIMTEGELQGKHLTEVQALARESLRQVWEAKHGLIQLSPKQKIRLAKLEEEYLHMIMGIGDLYQGGGKAFSVTEENAEIGAGRNSQELSILLSNMVLERAPNIDGEGGIFQYYFKVHNLMNDEYAPDRTTKMVYEKFSQALNAQIYEYLLEQQNQNPDKQEYYDALLLEFAYIISGRKTGKEYSWQNNIVRKGRNKGRSHTERKNRSTNMSQDLHDSELASEIITRILSRKGGVLEKMYQSGNIIIEDPEVGNQHPIEIIRSSTTLLKETLTIISRDQDGNETSKSPISEEGAQGYISQIVGNTDILGEASCYKDYQSMPLDLKLKISIIARLKNKLETNKKRLNSSGSTKRNAKKYTNENFGEVLTEITQDAFHDTVTSITDNFGFSLNGSFADDLKNLKDSDGNPVHFSETELAMFDLFHDILGTGLLNLSDTNKGYALTGAKIAALMAAAFVLTAATGGVAGALGAGGIMSNLIVQGSVMGAYAAPVSWVIFPEGHTTTQEMLWDRGSDIVISSGTGALGGVAAHGIGTVGTRIGLSQNNILTKGLGVRDAKMLSVGGLRNGAIFGGDLYFLGIKTEEWRNIQIAEYFHSDEIISDF